MIFLKKLWQKGIGNFKTVELDHEENVFTIFS